MDAPDVRGRVHRWSRRADDLAVEHAAAPWRALRLLLAASIAGLAVGVPAGILIRDDPALWLREGMPGTWLSGLMLLAAAAAARAAFRRERGHRRWHSSFWGLSAAILGALTAVELLQPTIYVGHWLEDRFGASAPLGIHGVDAVLLMVLMAAVLLALAPRVLVLRHHPRAALLLCVAGVCAVASQGLDSFMPVGEWQFVAEDGLKALGEPFLIAGYLVALRTMLDRAP